MRKLLVVLLALLALPALPAGALPDPGFHAPIRVFNDAMFPLIQGVSGDGSQAHPFVIAGARFEQLRSPAEPTLDGAVRGAEASIIIQDTTAFVTIKFNRFTAIDIEPGVSPLRGSVSTAIRIVNAQHVRIEQNSFEAVGTYLSPAVTFSGATDIAVVKNS